MKDRDLGPLHLKIHHSGPQATSSCIVGGHHATQLDRDVLQCWARVTMEVEMALSGWF